MIGPALSSLLGDKVTAPATAGARPALVTDGVDITKWRSGSFMPRAAVARIAADGACEVSPADGDTSSTPPDAQLIASGVELWGLDVDTWAIVGALKLDGGNIVLLDATHGFTSEFFDPSPFTRLALAGAASNGATATYTFAPLEASGSC